jgi:hypothetical protein
MNRPPRLLPRVSESMVAYIDVREFNEYMRLEDEYVKELREDRDRWKKIVLGP